MLRTLIDECVFKQEDSFPVPEFKLLAQAMSNIVRAGKCVETSKANGLLAQHEIARH